MRPRKTREWIQILYKVPLAEFKRYFIQEWRYPLEATGKLVMLYLLFRAITWGGNLLGPAMGIEAFRTGQVERLVGFVFFFLVATVVQGGAHLVKEESELGVFEQVCLSPVGLAYIILCRGASGVAANVVPMTLLFAFAVWSLSVTIQQVSLSVPLTIVLGTIGMQGIGFMLSGIALILKRIQITINLLTLFLLTISVLPQSQLEGNLQILASLFPFTQAIKLLSYSLLGQEVTRAQLTTLGVSSMVLFGIGYLTLGWMERIALDKGLIGQY